MAKKERETATQLEMNENPPLNNWDERKPATEEQVIAKERTELPPNNQKSAEPFMRPRALLV